MSKRNGRTQSPDSLTALRQTVAGYRAKLESLQESRNGAQSELDELIARRPEVASRARAGGDDRQELIEVNRRVLDIVDGLLPGLDYDTRVAKAELAEAEARLKEAEIAERRAERAARLSERNAALEECIASIRSAGDALARAGTAHDAANRIAHELGEPLADWRPLARQIEAVAVLALDKERGRYPIDVDIASRMTAGEARRVLAA